MSAIGARNEPSGADRAAAMVGAFARYRAWLAKAYPALAETLRGPAAPSDLQALESAVGHALPESLRALWQAHDGQDTSGHEGTVGGYWFLPVREALSEWRKWEEMRREPGFKPSLSGIWCAPDDTIQFAYTHPGWIPVLQEPGVGNYIGVDLAPDEKGRVGQVINFGRDDTGKFVLAYDLSEVFSWLAARVEAGAIAVHPHGGEHAYPAPYTALNGERLVYPLRDANLAGALSD